MCRSKHVEQLRNTGIIYSATRSHLVGYFYKIEIVRVKLFFTNISIVFSLYHVVQNIYLPVLPTSASHNYVFPDAGKLFAIARSVHRQRCEVDNWGVVSQISAEGRGSFPFWNAFRAAVGSTQLHINPLNPELNPICYLLALLGAHHFLHVSRIRVKLLNFRLLMLYIYIYMYGAPILDVSRSHTTTQHSR